jgi:hypothetical protein
VLPLSLCVDLMFDRIVDVPRKGDWKFESKKDEGFL